MTIAIRLLGRPEVTIDGRPQPQPRGQKPWALLALLLLSEAPLGRDRVARMLFADADDPLGSLRWNLAQVRRLLSAEVTIAGDPLHVTLPADAHVDVRTLARGTWTEALNLPGLGEELLDRVEPAADPAFEAWLLAERRRFAGLAAAVLREAATSRLATNDAPAAVRLATRLVELEEYDEAAHELLIRAHVASGSIVEARRYLEATAERFRRDLGVEPTPALLAAADGGSGAAAPRAGRGSRAGAESLIAAGEAAIAAGATEAGLETLRRAAVDADEAGDRRLVARALVALGSAYIHGVRGRDGEGATTLHEALRAARAEGAADLVSEACRELGYVELLRGRYDRAEDWLRGALGASSEAGLHAAALGVLGVVTCDQGRTGESLRLLETSAEEAATLDKPRLSAWAWTFLGRTHLLRDELPDARAALVRGLETARSAGWMTFVPLPQSLLGSVELAMGDDQAASDAFEAAFALGCQIGDPCWEGLGARGIGMVRFARGEVDAAIDWLDDARVRCIRLPDTYLWIHAFCLDTLVDHAIRVGEQRAGAWLTDLEAVAARTGMSELLVRAQLHGSALGRPGARDAATLFADRIDNPAVLRAIATPESAVA